jgi:hypothetical protein
MKPQRAKHRRPNRRKETINMSGILGKRNPDLQPGTALHALSVKIPCSDYAALEAHCAKLAIASGFSPGAERAAIVRRLISQFLEEISKTTDLTSQKS